MTARVNERDIHWMNLAVKQAKYSHRVKTAFCVGCVIIDHDTGELLSTGFSREIPGNTHAEECALRKLDSESSCRELVIYTTMEPCSTRLSGNKPCIEWIFQFNVKRVVCGLPEPTTFVICESKRLAQERGISIEYITSVSDECKELNSHLC